MKLLNALAIGLLLVAATSACDDANPPVAPSDTFVADSAQDGTSAEVVADVALDTVPEVAADLPEEEVAQEVTAEVTQEVAAEVAQPGPAVISVVPADGSSTDDTTPDILVTFDKNWIVGKLGPQDVTMVEVVDASADIPLTITVDYPKNNQGSIDPKVLKITPPTLAVGKTYRCSVTNVQDAQSNPMEGALEWTFSIEGCGDGVCSASEDQCGCSADCGGCPGCCEYIGPGYTCQPGTAKNKCGKNGQSCGVCEGTDQCIDGEGCG